MNLHHPKNNVCQDSPQSAMEKALLEGYLQQQEFCLADLAGLPGAQAKTLVTAASQYALLRLAQVESTAHFRQKLHQPS